MMRRAEESRRGVEKRLGRGERYSQRRREGGWSQREGDLGAGYSLCEELVLPVLKDTEELSQSLLTAKLSTDPELPPSPSSTSSLPFPVHRPSLPLHSSLVSILDEEDPSALLKLQVDLQIRLIREHLESSVRTRQSEQRDTDKAWLKRSLLRAYLGTGKDPVMGEGRGKEFLRAASKAETISAYKEEHSVVASSKERRAYRQQTAPMPSNRKLIRSAIAYSCCPGALFTTQRKAAFHAIDAFPSVCTFILLLTPVSHTLLGLYEFQPNSETVRKVYGAGACPDCLGAELVLCFYRYDLGVRQFRRVRRTGFSLATDAVTLKRRNEKYREK